TSAIREAGGAVVEGLEQEGAGGLSMRGIAGGTFLSNPAEAIASDAERGYQGVMQMSAAGLRPDALICSNDRYAFGAYRACSELGWRIPHRVAVTGFGGEDDMRFLTPSLTTANTLEFANAEMAVEQLLRKIKGGQIDSVVKIPCPPILRESCGARLRM